MPVHNIAVQCKKYFLFPARKQSHDQSVIHDSDVLLRIEIMVLMIKVVITAMNNVQHPAVTIAIQCRCIPD
jgi:hypothetical protein